MNKIRIVEEMHTAFDNTCTSGVRTVVMYTPNVVVNEAIDSFITKGHKFKAYHHRSNLLPFQQWEQKNIYNKGYTQPRGKRFRKAVVANAQWGKVTW